MKKLLIRLWFLNISVLLSFTFLIIQPAFASEMKQNGDVNILVTVQERNGIFVKDFFFRRGIALEQGLVYDPQQICLMDNGVMLPSAAEATERYEDGSVRWLLVSANLDLRPNELKELTVTNGTWDGSGTVCFEEQSAIQLNAKKLSLTTGVDGITSLKWKGREMLNGNSINPFVTVDGVTHYMRASSATVLKDTAGYKKIKLKGNIAQDIDGEMCITVADDASNLHIEYRFRFKEQLITSGMGLAVGRTYTGAEVGKVFDEDYLDLGDMQLSTYDNTRFNNGICAPTLTGYVIEKNRIMFAPLLYNFQYRWVDGRGRTSHLYINFENDAANYAKTLALPPSVSVDAEQYKKAGELKSTTQSVVFKQAIETVKFSYSKSVGYLYAGCLSSNADFVLGLGSPGDEAGGDIEYNLGVGYMLSGDEEVYRHMFDQSECRADLAVYIGNKIELNGCMSAKMGVSFSADYAFFSHGFYSDEGGLYMTYVLSGDEYIGEIFKLCVDKTVEDMYIKPANGGRGFLMRYWTDRMTNPKGNTSTSNFVEARGMIHARSLYLASRCFEDDRYKQAAYEIVKWAINTQEPSGAFNQAYWNNGRTYYISLKMDDGTTSYFPPIKDYTMLYGFRGISQLLDYEVDEATLALVLRVADHLSLHRERYGPWIMVPTGDPEICLYDQDGSRGYDPRSNVLAIDVLCTAYEHTKSERYLESICAYMEASLTNTSGGLALLGKQPDNQRTISFLRTSDNLAVIFEENRDKLIGMGYESLYIAFAEDAVAEKKAEVNMEYPVVCQNVYSSQAGKVIFLRFSPTTEQRARGELVKTVTAKFDENYLWQGNDIMGVNWKSPITGATEEHELYQIVETNASVTLEKEVEINEKFVAVRRPISVEEICGKAKIKIENYCKDEISMTLSGDYEITLNIEDGRFPIKDGNGYTIKIQPEGSAVTLVVTPGGTEKTENGVLSVKFNGMGQRIETVGTKLFATYGIKEYEPNAPLSGEVLSALIEKSFGHKVSFSKEQPTWNSFANEVIGAAAASESDLFDEYGFYTLVDGCYDVPVTDEEAVRMAADALEVIFEGEGLSSDVYLAKKGLYQTDITWKSEREDILNTDGILTRRYIDCENITLTAIVTRGKAIFNKDFVIPLEKPVVVPMISSQAFGDDTRTVLIEHTGTCEFTFDAQVTVDNTDTIIYLSSSKTPVTALPEEPYLVRFSPNGVVDTRDGASFYAANEVPYKKGDIFHFRMVVRLDEQTYDAYVTPDGGEEIILGLGMQPRLTAKPIHRIDQISLWGSKTTAISVYNISNIDYAKSKAVNVMIRDDAGNLYDPYDSLDDYVLPDISENGNIINWLTINSTIRRNGRSVRVRLGVESKGTKSLNLADVLHEFRMLDKNIQGNEYVTPASLTRLLSMINKVNSNSDNN